MLIKLTNVRLTGKRPHNLIFTGIAVHRKKVKLKEAVRPRDLHTVLTQERVLGAKGGRVMGKRPGNTEGTNGRYVSLVG